jgi:phosphohistidine phosphatase
MVRRHLILVRHAKAAEHAGEDAARPLSERGERDAPAIGRWLAAQDIAPQRAVVSPARRARQTWEMLSPQLSNAPQPDVDDRVFANTTAQLLDVIRETSGDVEALVLVGHNPSIGELARTLDDEHGEVDARDELDRGFPPGGVAIFALNEDWSAVRERTATLLSMAAPRG